MEAGMPNDPILHLIVSYDVLKDYFWLDLYCLLSVLSSNWIKEGKTLIRLICCSMNIIFRFLVKLSYHILLKIIL